MSWFADLAGRAEDLLNLVDQGAATALSKSKDGVSAAEDAADYYPDIPPESSSQTYRKSSFISSAADNIKQQKATLLAGTANARSSSRPSAHASSTTSHRAASSFVRRKKSEPDDELLFDFLNSSDKANNGVMEPKRESGREGAPRTPPGRGDPPGVQPPEATAPGMQGDPIQSLQSAEEQPDTTASSPGNGDHKSQELSSLRLENQLLRSEVQSLNQEMAGLIQRCKETQDELYEARLRIERWNGDHSKSDRTTRELRSQVDDLSEALAAKDSQLAVLKVRLQEADQVLSSRTEALETLQGEKSRILQDHNEGSSLHSQALQSVQERLREAEATLKREQDGFKQMQNESAARLSKMEAERQNLAESVMAAERRQMEEKRRGDDLQQQLKAAKTTAETLRQEMADYKQKATRILQSKEKLINSLKDGSGMDGLDGQTAGGLELEELRHERDLQREEIQRLQNQVQQVRSELQDVETQQVSEAESAREQLQDCQEQMAEQRRAKQELEAELERQKQELQYTQEDLYRTKNTLQGRIRDREDEIQKLRNQLTNKALSSSSHSELENRLHQLTETLIQKQTVLESLSTEKNSLVYQLERLEHQLKSAQGSGSTINMAAVDSADGARLRNVPVLFSDADTNVAGMYGRVRKAASTIDRFSIRLGVFLRRYPIARVFIIIYMALLHLWVMIVLLTYTPEMHHDHPPGK